MSKPYSQKERDAVAEFRRKYPGDSQREVARYAIHPLPGESHVLEGRSFDSVYHAVRRYDQEQKPQPKMADDPATAAA